MAKITRDEWFRTNSAINSTPVSQERVYPEAHHDNRHSGWSDPLADVMGSARDRAAAIRARHAREVPPPPAIEIRFAADMVMETGMHAYPKRGERMIEPKRRLPVDVQAKREKPRRALGPAPAQTQTTLPVQRPDRVQVEKKVEFRGAQMSAVAAQAIARGRREAAELEAAREAARLRANQVGSPFRVDWTDLEAVKDYARQCGPGMVVIKRAERPNFNITHAERTDRYVASEVVFRT